MTEDGADDCEKPFFGGEKTFFEKEKRKRTKRERSSFRKLIASRGLV